MKKKYKFLLIFLILLYPAIVFFPSFNSSFGFLVGLAIFLLKFFPLVILYIISYMLLYDILNSFLKKYNYEKLETIDNFYKNKDEKYRLLIQNRLTYKLVEWFFVFRTNKKGIKYKIYKHLFIDKGIIIYISASILWGLIIYIFR